MALTKSSIGVDKLGLYVCTALGLNPKKVKSLTLVMEAGMLPEITVEMFAHDDDIENAGKMIRQFDIKATLKDAD